MTLNLDEIDVYRACLSSGTFGQRPVVSDATNGGILTASGTDEFWETVPFMKKVSMHELDVDTCEGYLRSNLEVTHLPKSFEDECGVLLISDEEFQKHLSVEGFGSLVRNLYPSSIGLLQFSRPGFNETRTQALLYYAQLVGELASYGIFQLYCLNDSTWCLSGSFIDWQS